MDEKLLVLDIDGTLTNSKKQITKATRDGITKILKQGHKVILASGRPTHGMRRYEEELELQNYGGYLLSFNGGRIIECQSQEVVYQRILPPEILTRIYTFAKVNGCGLITYQKDRIISAFKTDKYVELESRINGMDVFEVEDFLSYVDFDMNKCLMTAPIEKAPEFEQKLKQELGDLVSVYRSEPFFIEIMPKNVDKATSLARMLEILHLSRENMICCGDGYNDITMIEYAGVGVAMGNAYPAVKEASDYVTTTNDENGLVPVIDKFILKTVV